MFPNDIAEPPGRVAPQDDQQASKNAVDRSDPTIAPVISLRTRRAAASRLPPIGDDSADPLDDLAGITDQGHADDAEDPRRQPWPRDSAARQIAAEELAADVRKVHRLPAPHQIEWGSYDVHTLGLTCSHQDGHCAGRRRKAV